MSTVWISRRALAVVITAATLAAVAIGSDRVHIPAGAAPARRAAIPPKALASHDGMRALWEAHGTWTERAIVDFVGGLPDTQLVIGGCWRISGHRQRRPAVYGPRPATS